MNVGLAVDMAISEALTVMVLIASPVLGAALATGLIIGSCRPRHRQNDP